MEKNKSNNTDQGCVEKIHDADVKLIEGAWTEEEDFRLTNHIKKYGRPGWNSLPKAAGLRRTGRSCRLRWMNHLRPHIRRSNLTLEEQLIMVKHQKLLGNKWFLIASGLPGRTDNEIKNHWHKPLKNKHKEWMEPAMTDGGGSCNDDDYSDDNGDDGDGDNNGGGGGENKKQDGSSDGDGNGGNNAGDNNGSRGGRMKGNQMDFNVMGQPGFDYKYGYHAGSQNGYPVGQLQCYTIEI